MMTKTYIVSNIEITEGQADKLNGLADWEKELILRIWDQSLIRIYVVVVVVSFLRCCDSTTEFYTFNKKVSSNKA